MIKRMIEKGRRETQRGRQTKARERGRDRHTQRERVSKANSHLDQDVGQVDDLF